MRIKVWWVVTVLVVTDVWTAQGFFDPWVNTNPGTRCHNPQNLTCCRNLKSRSIL